MKNMFLILRASLTAALVLTAMLFMSFPLTANSGDVAARMRLYEGFRNNSDDLKPKVVSSYYIKQLQALEPYTPLPEINQEIQSLKRVFNMTAVKLVTDAGIVMRKAGGGSFQVIVLNGRKLLVRLEALPGQKR